MPRRAVLCGVGVALALMFAAVCLREASAHASLVKAEPADASVLTEPPAALSLTFNEPISPLAFRLIGPAGEAINSSVTAENETVTLTPPRLGQGTHVLSWRVISADGHPVGGALTFSVGAPSAPPTDVAARGDVAARIALWALKVMLYIGLFVGIGGAFFRAWIDDAGASRGWLTAVLGLGLVADAYSVSFQGLDALDLPFMDALDPRTWAAGLATTYGLTAVAAAAALAAGLISLPLRNRRLARALSVAALLGAALALALSGHAATAAPRLLTAPSVFVHVACVAFWMGSLAPLLVAVRDRGAAKTALARFSRAIPYPLAALVVSGAVLACVQLDRPDALWTTNYGLVLSGKLAAVVVLLGLGAANRYRLVPRFEARGTTAAARALTMSIAAEIAIAVLAVALVALWRFTPPPRALAVEPTSIHFHGERAMAQIEVEPVRGRGAALRVQVLDGEFRPLAVKEVRLAFFNPAAGIEPLRRVATHVDGVLWRIDDLRIPLAGRWRLRVEILIDDFDKVVLEDDVILPRAP